MYKGSHPTAKRVHRLVAEAFIANPHNYLYVNHIDEDKSNNSVDNLEWCSAEYNNSYGSRLERVAKSLSKPVLQCDLKGNVLKRFESIQAVEDELGIWHSNIIKVLNNERNSAGGFC